MVDNGLSLFCENTFLLYTFLVLKTTLSLKYTKTKLRFEFFYKDGDSACLDYKGISTPISGMVQGG